MNQKSSSIEAGFEAETRALAFLKTQQLSFIYRNFRCKQGEIDLIMQEKDTLVFVEVRKRSHLAYGSGLDSVTTHKQQRLVRAATVYLLEQSLYEKIICRFDIVSIDKNGEMTWIKNAFELVY
jgi:putative endonuclease